MAGSTVSSGWRGISVRDAIMRSAGASLRADVLDYLVRTPFVVVCTLWIICLPFMYFALYGDLAASVSTLAEMTVIFLGFLMTFMVSVTSVCLLASFVAHMAGRTRRRKLDYRL